MKHTPGPWEVKKIDHHYATYTIKQAAMRQRARQVDGVDSADSNEYGILEDGELQANARLIAAAPELLDALKVTQNRHCVGLKDGKGKTKSYTVRFSATDMAQIRAAIAKAEGKS